MCGKAVDNYVHALEFVSDYCKAQKCVINLSVPAFDNTICSWLV